MLITNLDRVQVLDLLGQGGTVAEVGVYKGHFSTAIRAHAKPDMLHLIDTWALDDAYVQTYGTQRDSLLRAYDLVQSQFIREIEAGRVVVHRDYSTRAAVSFPDAYFDWVYIDAMHDYENVLADLLSFKDKVKPEGFILGHDFSNNPAGRRAKFGVVRAVRDFMASEGFELVLITNETSPTYLLARSGNATTLPALREALMQRRAPLPIEVDVQLLDQFEQVPVVGANGASGQLIRFGSVDEQTASAPNLAAAGTRELHRSQAGDSASAASDGNLQGSVQRTSVPPFFGGDLYLDLMKECLTRSLFGNDLRYRSKSDEFVPSTPDLRSQGRDWPAEAETMIGLKRLDNLQHCIVDVLRWGVPGDLIETGVWRGGATIFMRAVLKVYGDSERLVWVADSFAGLPEPDVEQYPADAKSRFHQAAYLAIPIDDVKANFARYHLLDDRVRFLKGWFRDTLPVAPVERLAVLRLDGDMYESTIVALRQLYPKLSVGGYVIVDDYGAVRSCRQAVKDYRAEHNITDPIHEIDWTGAYWQRR